MAPRDERVAWLVARARAAAPVIVLALGALWISDHMRAGPWWASHENLWYPVRVREYLESWRGGGWYPRWCPDLYGGYGYPFFNYYAPGVYFAGALGAEAGLSPADALKLAMTLVAVAGAGAAYGLVLGETGRRDAAFVGAAAYVFLPYRATDLFARGDLAEYAAYALVPFVVWGYRALGRARGDRMAVIAAATALAHAGVLLTHTIVGMFTTEIAGVYVVVQLVRGWRGPARPALVAGAAMAFAIAMSAVYTVPALLERHLVHLERITDGRFKSWLNTIDLVDLADPFFTPGMVLAVAVALWLGALAVPRTRRGAVRATGWYVTSLVLVLLLVHWAEPVWHVLPFGAEVQFPWRLLGFIGLFGAVGLGVVWASVVPAKRWLAPVLAAVAVVPMPLLIGAQLRVTPAELIPDTVEDIRALHDTSTAMDEYEPATAPMRPPHRTVETWSETQSITVQAEELDGLHHTLVIDAAAPGDVGLAVFRFPGWKLHTLAGPDGAALRTNGLGLMRIHLPAAGHYELEVAFGNTWVRTIAALVSLLALLATYPVLRWWRRKVAASA